MITLLLCLSLLGAEPLAPASVNDTLLPPPQQVPPPSARSDTLGFYELMALTVTVARTSIPLRANPGATTVVDARNLTAMTRTIAVDAAMRLAPARECASR